MSVHRRQSGVLVDHVDSAFKRRIKRERISMYRLVIADDEFTIRNGIAQIINWRELGFEVKGRFEDGREVIEYMKTQSADVIFTDVEMYEVSGLEVAKWVADNRPGVIVVMISGYKEFDYVKEALQVNVFDYILKPINPKEIEEVFRKIRQKLDKERAKERQMEKSTEEAEVLLSSVHAIKKAKEYIESHLAEDLSVEKIADSVALSQSYFSREFKRQTGDSVMDYVIRVRMNRAMDMICKGEKSQSKIASSVGYSDLKYFQRSFKKHTGYTVKEYRRLQYCGD